MLRMFPDQVPDVGFGLEYSASGLLQLAGLGLAGANEVVIAERVLSVAETTITFSDISQDFDSLRIFISGRGDNASNTVTLSMEANGDTVDGSYHSQRHISQDGAGTHESGEFTTDKVVAALPAASATSGAFSTINIDIPEYTSSTKRKIATSERGYEISATNLNLTEILWLWKDTAAITDLEFTLTAGDFVSGTVIRLIGVKAGTAAQVGGRTKIAEISLSGTQTTLSFANIPSKYDHLELDIKTRTDDAGTDTKIQARFNGETSGSDSKYHGQRHLVQNGVTHTVTEFSSDPHIARGAASASPSGTFHHSTCRISHYSDSDNNKFTQSTGGMENNSGDLQLVTMVTRWSDTSPITDIDLTSGSGGDFVSGTRAILYGIGGADQTLSIEANTVSRTLTTSTDLALHKILTNEGAVVEVVFTLPTAVAGLRYRAIVEDANGIKFTAASGDTISVGDFTTVAAGSIALPNVGTEVEIVAVNDTKWIMAVTGVEGVWVDQYEIDLSSLSALDIRTNAGSVMTIDGKNVFVGTEVTARDTSINVVNGTGIVWIHNVNNFSSGLYWQLEGAAGLFPGGISEDSRYRIQWEIDRTASWTVDGQGVRMEMRRDDLTEGVYARFHCHERISGADSLQATRRTAGSDTTRTRIKSLTYPIILEIEHQRLDGSVLRYQENTTGFPAEEADTNFLFSSNSELEPADAFEPSDAAGDLSDAPSALVAAFRVLGNGSTPAYTIHLLKLRAQEFVAV